MDIQAENNLFSEISEVNKNRSITPNTLHKTLIEIAQQTLVNSDNQNNNEKVNRCENNNVHSVRTEKKKTLFSPFTIKFNQRPSKSELQLEKELFLFWKKCSSSTDPTRLHVLTRFGFEGRLQIHAQDKESYDTLVGVEWPTHLDNQSITVLPPIRVPPHLSIVVRDVPLSWQLPEIKEEIENRYGNGSIRNIVRMYGRDGNPIQFVRLDTSNSSYISTFLNDGFINIGYGRHAVKEYRLPIRISSPCYNCYEHGHIARHCKNPKRCSRCSQQHEGECANEIKCVNCGGHHYPGQSTCPIVQRLRAEKRQQQQQQQPTITYSYAAAANRPQPPPNTRQPSALVITSELQAQLTSINKKLDEVKQTFLDLNVKLSDKVSQLEGQLVEAEKRIDILSSKINYRSEEAGIRHINVKKSITNVLLPVIIDISKAIAATTRSQASRKEIETICNDAQNALQDLDEEKDKEINNLRQRYPLLKFNFN
jgi:chemotaxis protein histidine kinase CheA